MEDGTEMGADEADIPKGADKAAAQPGAKRRVKPPVTIDLQAESVAPEPGTEQQTAAETPRDEPPQQALPPQEPPSEPPPSGPPETAAPTRPQYGVAALAAAGAAGGLVVLALGFGLQAAGLIPTPGRDIALQAHATGTDLATKLTGLDQRLQSIEAASSQTIADRALLDDLARRVGVADAFGRSLGDRLLTLEASVAALEDKAAAAGGSATQESVDALAGRIAGLEARQSGDGTPAAPVAAAANSPDIAALEQRMTAIEAKLALLESQPAAPEAAEPAATTAVPNEALDRADAVAALRVTSAAGGNFGSELAVVGAFGLAADQVKALAPLAEKNVPNAATIARQFPEVANAILATADGADGSIMGQLRAFGRSLVRVRPSDAVAGGDPEAIVSRIEAALKAGKLAEARTEWEKLPAAEQEVSRPWADQLADRVAIDRLVEELASALGASAGSG